MWWAVRRLIPATLLGIPRSVSAVLAALLLLWVISASSAVFADRNAERQDQAFSFAGFSPLFGSSHAVKPRSCRQNQIFHEMTNVTVDWASTITGSDQAMVLPLALFRSGTEIATIQRDVQRSQFDSNTK